jgi:hypothetical protein
VILGLSPWWWAPGNQRGRRNVTKEQRDYISGKRYQAQRNIDRRRDKTGIFISNAPTEHFTQLDNKRSDVPTANKIAAAMGMTAEVVRRNAPYAIGIDAIKEVSPELADKILKPKPDQNDQVNVEEMGLSDPLAI